MSEDDTDDLHAKIAKVGLCAPRGGDTLETIIRDFIATNRGGKEDSTIKKWGDHAKTMVEFFKPDRKVTTITRTDCDKYKTWLLDDKEYAQSTAGKAIRNARMFFTQWVRSEVLTRNPFDGVKGSNAIDESRTVYISPEVVQTAMGYCHDAEWRAIFALARFGGLRPSEIVELRLNDIKWDRGLIVVRSPKTKRHEGGGQREIPMKLIPESFLLDMCETAEEGAVYVLDRLRKRSTGVRRGNKPNLGKIVHDILDKAGIEKWTKPFVSMRASCVRNVVDVYGEHKASLWMGHSKEIARKHYYKSLPEDFERAKTYKVVDTKKGEVDKKVDTLEKRQVCSNTGRCETPQNTVYHASDDIGNTAKQRIMGGTGFEPVTSAV